MPGLQGSIRAGEPSSPDAKAIGTVLGIRDTRITLNGQPAFLPGISYYGGLGAPEEFIRRDLEDLQRHGFQWLREVRPPYCIQAGKKPAPCRGA